MTGASNFTSVEKKARHRVSALGDDALEPKLLEHHPDQILRGCVEAL
jgi:hypothetical protein